MTNLKALLRFSTTLLSLFTWTAAFAQITPLGDSYTNTADPTTNYGGNALLDVDGASQITYIQFNLASIPAKASISQATLKLYVNSVVTAGSFNVDYVNSSWLESTIDAHNAPPLGGAIASNVDVTTADKNQYILVNVTSAVEAWLSGSEKNNGLALVADSTFNATFDSKENTTTSHPAELDIAFAGGDGTITGVDTGSSSGLTGGGTSGTLNLSLLTGCASNQVLQWNGSSWKCSSAGTGTITGVTAGTDLTGGGSSGNVTLNLNTSNIPQLNSANAFSGLNTFPNVGVGTSSTLANLDVIGGGGLHILTGDPGCGTFAAIAFQTQPMSGCSNYALLGDSVGDTYINASGSGSTIVFRLNNTVQPMGIFPNGTVGIGTASPQAALDVETTNDLLPAGYFQDDAAERAALWAINDAPSPDQAFALSAGGYGGYCVIDTGANLGCAGSKSAVVPVDAGSRKVALYAVEAPENWFEDYGSGQLFNGSARIDLEPIFAQTVNTDLDYHVFLTPNGDCKGLYVSQKSPTSFEVHELAGGTSSVAFDYRIIAKRKNYETIRLADRTEQFKKLDEQLAKMRQRKHDSMRSPATSPQSLVPAKETAGLPKVHQQSAAPPRIAGATLPSVHQ